MKKLLIFIVALLITGGVGAGFVYWNSLQGMAPSTLESKYLRDVDRFINVAGARVRVREEGPEEGPVLILLHGFIYSLETWDAWASALSGEYRVVRYDLLGHGLTGPDAQRRYAPAERAAFVGDVMTELGIEKAIIGGNSLGGLAAWRFAATHPERVNGLILVAPGGYSIHGVKDRPVSAPEPMKLFLRTAPDVAVKATLEQIFADNALATPQRVELLRDMMRREGNGDAFVESIEEFILPDPELELQRISAPTLILWGDQDALIPVEHGPQFESAIPNAELIIYDEVGHVPQEEIAVKSVRDTLSFLAMIDGSHK